MLAALALAGCGGSAGNSSSGSSSAPKVTVTGAFGTVPKVTIPSQKAGATLQVQHVIAGSGATVPSTDAVLGNYVAYIWSGSTHKLAQSTYSTVPALFGGHLLTGLTDALKDARVGERVLAVLPPKYGYGTQGNTSGGVKPGDTLVFVIDVIKAYAATAAVTGKTVSTGGNGLPTVTSANPPQITIPKNGTAPKTLVSKTLIQGTGPAVKSGQQLIVQYVGMNWRTSQIFDASEKDGDPYGFVLGLPSAQGGVIQGWTTGLEGKKVGSRVMLVIPPKDGYGSQGSSQAGIKGTDTLVFVIDILGAYGAHST
ncbi:MAG TPA: FKBP-type peptidyl-prolyl cis-trans isomerase [Streptosporangiaceae bacterium]|nr:FKBP-type peptidyl-prolyl cis-trans isomerase [Streptosporangiaceae bacterium]